MGPQQATAGVQNFRGGESMNSKTEMRPRPHLLSLELRSQTDQQRVAREFMARVGDIENFVILAQTKDGESEG